MLRITKLIGRDRIFDYLNDPKVHKVVVSVPENKGLTNPHVCRIQLYLNTENAEKNKDHVLDILGQCRKNSVNPMGKGVNSFLKGILTQGKECWLSGSHIKKLLTIQEKEKINLSIPKYFVDLINEYSDKK